MRAIVYDAHGGVDQLALRELPDPITGPGEALVRVRAAGLNGFDPMMLGGTTGLKVPFPMTPCGDAAGEVADLGPETTDSGLALGDRVMLDPSIPGQGMFGETVPGTCREYITAPTAAFIAMPDEVTFAQAAALPVAYGTALKMMEDRGKVTAGERVLILGATGGVGCCCVQFAKRVGAEVVATGRGAWKLDQLRELGADHVIDTSEADFVETVHELWGRPRYKEAGAGADVVVNYIGGDTWSRSLKVLGDGGRLLTCGATAGYDPQTDIRYIWSFEQNIIGSDGWTRDGLGRLLEWAAMGTLAPTIHAERPIEDTVVAMQELIDRQVFGKSILLP